MSEPLNRLASLPTVIVTGYFQDSPGEILTRTCKIGTIDPETFTDAEEAYDENVVFYYALCDEFQVGKVIADTFVITALSYPDLLSPSEYAQKKGCICPLCKSEEVEGFSIDVDCDTATQEVHCNDCGFGWTDKYLLSGYSVT